MNRPWVYSKIQALADEVESLILVLEFQVYLSEHCSQLKWYFQPLKSPKLLYEELVMELESESSFHFSLFVIRFVH